MTTLRETLRTMSDDMPQPRRTPRGETPPEAMEAPWGRPPAREAMKRSVLTLDVAGVSAGLVRPGRLWREVRAVAETGSSNADLLAAAGAGAAEGTVLVAEAQPAR